LAGGFREHDTQKPDSEDADDHKNDDPMAAAQKSKGRNGQAVKTDSGAMKTDFTLGDLSAPDNFAPQSRAQKPTQLKPPTRASRPAGSAAADPALDDARRNSAAVVKADSPGRVHQLLEGDAKQSKTAGEDY
jgi:hypothetical protein